MKKKFLSALIAFILAIVVVAGLNKLAITDIMIDSNLSLAVAIAALLAVFIHGYVDKKL